MCTLDKGQEVRESVMHIGGMYTIWSTHPSTGIEVAVLPLVWVGEKPVMRWIWKRGLRFYLKYRIISGVERLLFVGEELVILGHGEVAKELISGICESEA